MIHHAGPCVVFFIMVSQLSSYDSQNFFDPIGRFISTRSRMAPPTQEEYDTLFKDMNAGCPKARNELIERHARLVASIALKFRMTNIPMEDLMAEGIQGLIVALDKFDHTRGVKLSTYAAWWIRQKIQRLVGKLSHPVTVPHDVSPRQTQVQPSRGSASSRSKSCSDGIRNRRSHVRRPQHQQSVKFCSERIRVFGPARRSRFRSDFCRHHGLGR